MRRLGAFALFVAVVVLRRRRNRRVETYRRRVFGLSDDRRTLTPARDHPSVVRVRAFSDDSVPRSPTDGAA